MVQGLGDQARKPNAHQSKPRRQAGGRTIRRGDLDGHPRGINLRRGKPENTTPEVID
jgi:hypothetical protein